MKKLIIFDCDGVLVDSEQLTNKVLVDCLNELNFEMQYEEAFRKFKGCHLAECIAYIEAKNQKKLPPDFAQFFRAKMGLEFEVSLKPIPGVKEAIEELSDYNICVASNGPPQKMQKTLSLTGLLHHFGSNIYSAYSIQKWKPEPDLFLYASSQHNVEPNNCIVIEDSVFGVTAAKRAKMKVLGFAGANSADELANAGAQVFNDMLQLPKLIEQYFKN